ncbi:MAG: hypothetical protein GF331_26925 [Chitinivibrionales bacterium]|nr:hypothetical protein [Chitinivibrionales bacterium]
MSTHIKDTAVSEPLVAPGAQNPDGAPIKVLVAIANHGHGNARYLKMLIDTFKSMRHAVKVVVLSDVPKELGEDVEVRVGAPTSDPWSLPFAYKPLFMERADDYDLFIYSEDDTHIEERHIDGYLEATRVLPDDRIAGFVRYELDGQGDRYYSSIFGPYHWEPGSVEKHGGMTFARLTNDHSGAFMLTRDQLKRCIAHGGFMAPPRSGTYDMLVTAATDPYTQCGLRKMICISELNRFALHHLPNKYWTRELLWIADERIVKAQLAALASSSGVQVSSLFARTPGLRNVRWHKVYYEGPVHEVMQAIPPSAKHILSVGMGCGSTEVELVRRGHAVHAIPLDSVVGAWAESMGVQVASPDWHAAGKALTGIPFDAIVVHDTIQYVEDPAGLLAEMAQRFRARPVVLTYPNVDHVSLRKQLVMNGPDRDDVRSIGDYEVCGVHATTPHAVDRWATAAGLRRHRLVPLFTGEKYLRLDRLTLGRLRGLLAHRFLAVYSTPK